MALINDHKNDKIALDIDQENEKKLLVENHKNEKISLTNDHE